MHKYSNPEINHPPASAEIITSPNEVRVVLKDIYLEDGFRENLGKMIVSGEKLPLNMEVIEVLQHIDFTDSNEQTNEIIKAAEELSLVSDERARIDALLKLLKGHVTYGYENVIEEKAKQFGVDKTVVDKMGTKGNSQVNFTKLLNYGVGICGHLSEAYLYLANKAQLKGALVHSHSSYPPTNVLREDNQEKLFKSTEVGNKTANHAWVEIQITDGSWIPVDPSTELTGTTKEGLETFRKAGYQGNITNSIDFDFERDSEIGPNGTDQHPGLIPAGESDFKIDMKLGLRKKITIGKKEPVEHHRKYEKLQEEFKVISRNYLMGAKFIDVQFEPES